MKFCNSLYSLGIYRKIFQAQRILWKILLVVYPIFIPPLFLINRTLILFKIAICQLKSSISAHPFAVDFWPWTLQNASKVKHLKKTFILKTLLKIEKERTKKKYYMRSQIKERENILKTKFKMNRNEKRNVGSVEFCL